MSDVASAVDAHFGSASAFGFTKGTPELVCAGLGTRDVRGGLRSGLADADFLKEGCLLGSCCWEICFKCSLHLADSATGTEEKLVWKTPQ